MFRRIEADVEPAARAGSAGDMKEETIAKLRVGRPDARRIRIGAGNMIVLIDQVSIWIDEMDKD